MQLVFRFVIGGLVVSLFAVIGDVLKPKSFAGLFGSALFRRARHTGVDNLYRRVNIFSIGSTLDDRRCLRLFRLRLLLHAGYGEARRARDDNHDSWSGPLARLCNRLVVPFSEVASDENPSRFVGVETNAIVLNMRCASFLAAR